MKTYIIQKQIKVDQTFVDNVISRYKQLSPRYWLGIGSWDGNRDSIIKEIEKMSDIGKRILLMDYTFKQALESGEFQKLDKVINKKPHYFCRG